MCVMQPSRSRQSSTNLQRSKVNNIVDIRVLLKHLIQLLLIGDVQRVVLGPLAADELDAVEDLLGGVVEVVDDDDLVVGLEEGKGGERADVAGATGKRIDVRGWTIGLLGVCDIVAGCRIEVVRPHYEVEG